jgi:hypothetical protein
VRHRHGDRLQRDEPGDTEPLDEHRHRADEALPAVVRLDAVQQQERLAGVVLDGVDHDLRGGVGLVAVAGEGDPRPVRPVVDQAVDVEPGDHLVRQAGQQVGAGECAGRRGVELPGQVVHEHQATARGAGERLRLPVEEGLRPRQQLDELLRTLHHGRTSLLNTPTYPTACLGTAAFPSSPTRAVGGLP